jgi:D-arabinose 1-dehydrogenase-like Zn-dependent alcohol dehydrogenase
VLGGKRKRRRIRKALVYCGARDVRIENVFDPKIENAKDVLVKITSTNICGSDLRMYEGRTDVEVGKVLGHESLGEVIEVGKAVERVKVRDMVCLPFNISCGYCKNCERGLTGFCLTANPGKVGAAYGYAGKPRTRTSILMRAIRAGPKSPYVPLQGAEHLAATRKKRFSPRSKRRFAAA